MRRFTESYLRRRIVTEVKQKCEEQNMVIFVLDIKLEFNRNKSVTPYLVYSFTNYDWKTKVMCYNKGLIYDDTYDTYGLDIKDDFDVSVAVDDLVDSIKSNYKLKYMPA